MHLTLLAFIWLDLAVYYLIQIAYSTGGVNVAEALVSKGLATVVRYAADNDQRSSKYDDLLAAEDKALKSKKG